MKKMVHNLCVKKINIVDLVKTLFHLLMEKSQAVIIFKAIHGDFQKVLCRRMIIKMIDPDGVTLKHYSYH